MNIIDGKIVSKKIRNDIKEKVMSFKNSKPKLTVIIVGDDEASKVYCNAKKKACNNVGIESELIELPNDTTKDELLELVNNKNNDNTVHGILVQLPLPKHINEHDIISAISPIKDVDGFHPLNVGRFNLNIDTFIPCTPLGVMKLLDHYNIDVKGKDVVVIGKSNIVGRPMATLLINEGATVSILHSLTKDLNSYTSKADIVISATGVKGLIKENMVKENVIIVDIGISRENGKLYGDVDFENVSRKASYITPVPGGVGPMTISMLLNNTIKAYEKINEVK